ncbi:TPA: 50S ribosomal protein L2 [Candidatus Peribacteria bacterium]|nr:MAG: 50S ribosomal protein L2 [Candidatus Peribacteria bacterium RIFOXYC2_FULL_58_10]OGJ84925.1 MAG: 50S ribosomal protein L2 [Candidatus Peribacteria bacterium RIFOXYD2_FULL_58_15]HAI99003.1 50S ribosomal protein L2 [Candidatus Peribacteria bacterium]HAS34808.1 50S ribosomal protein L2 [Candidatus Peribacteria bacterium]
MAIKILKPTTPGRRQMTIADFSDLTAKRPEKRLASGRRRISGRNSAGRLTIRHRGGGHKRLWRSIDFKRTDKAGVPGCIAALEYDPNRSARIALVHYIDGSKRYILAPEGLKVGDQIVCAERTKVKLGNRMQLQHIPVGYKIHDVEIVLGKGGCIVRSAGTAAILVGFDGVYALVQLPSGELRKVRRECSATIGTVSNPEHNLISIGKAGRTRWLGRRPQVLGKSMNAVDHPHGGGEGHSPIGLKAPKTPWGKKALGVKTRSVRKSRRLIVRPRIHKKRKK